MRLRGRGPYAWPPRRYAKFPAMRDVFSQGLCDRYSWIEGFEPPKDGAQYCQMLYDTQFPAKPDARSGGLCVLRLRRRADAGPGGLSPPGRAIRSCRAK